MFRSDWDVERVLRRSRPLATTVPPMVALTHKLVIHPTPGTDRDAYCSAVTSLIVGYVSGTTQTGDSRSESTDHRNR